MILKHICTAAKAALFVCCIIVSLTTCATLQGVVDMPLVSLNSVELVDVDYNGVQLLCKVRVENPNAFAIPGPQIAWRIYINDNSFISGVIERSQRIGARGTSIIEVPASLEYLEIFRSFASLRGREQIDYKAALDVSFPLPVIESRAWNLEYEGNIPLLRSPRLSSPVMRVEDISLTMVELYVSVNVENPNDFELPVPRLSFDFMVHNTSILQNRLNNRGPLAASSVTPVVFGLLVYYADLFRILPAVWAAGEVSSQLNLSIDFQVPAFNGETFDLQIPGTLPLTRR